MATKNRNQRHGQPNRPTALPTRPNPAHLPAHVQEAAQRSASAIMDRMDRIDQVVGEVLDEEEMDEAAFLDPDDQVDDEDDDQEDDDLDSGDEEDDEEPTLTTRSGQPLREYTAASYNRGKLIPLPSGGSIRIKPFSLISALKHGNMPNNLINAAREMIYGDSDKILQLRKRQEAQRGGNSAASKGDRQADVMDYMVIQMVASFNVVDKTPDQCRRDEVSIEAILECDKIAIVGYAMQGQKALRDFR